MTKHPARTVSILRRGQDEQRSTDRDGRKNYTTPAIPYVNTLSMINH